MDWSWGGGSFGQSNPRNTRTTINASNDESDHKQLLRLTICQALQSQYVMEHTRGIDRFLSPKINNETEQNNFEDMKENKDNTDIENKENSLTSLVDIALNESKSRHVTAGFLKFNHKNNSNQNKENNLNIIMLRLGRELSAIGLSSDLSYLSLTNKRSIILNKIILEYQKEYRLKGMALLKKKTFNDTSHSLLKITVNSGVFFMLTMLESSSLTNPSLCVKILNFLQAQLTSIKPMELETNDKLPLPTIAENAFDSVNKTLFNIASNKFANKVIRYKCLELLLMLSVSRATLSILLSVIYLLLFEFNPFDVFKDNILLNSICCIRRMKRMIRLDLPNKQNQILRASILNVCDNVSHCSITTDGEYLFIHSNKGISKIGTGINNTSPGSLIKQIPKYRQSEKSSIACIGEHIYYRSGNISKFCEAIVISTDSLNEIGYIKRDGKGTVATADNSHVYFGLKITDIDEMDQKNDGEDADDEKKNDDQELNNINTIRQRLRTIQNRIMQLENAGLDDGDEIEDLEMEYEDLFNALPEDIQDIVEDYDSSLDDIPIAIDHIISATDGAGATANNKDKKDKKDKKKSKIPIYNPLISDGRFLYAIIPEKPIKTEQEKKTNQPKDDEEEEEISHIYIRINAFDPMCQLEHCNTILLKRPLPSENSEVILDFNPSDETKRKLNQSQSTANPYTYDPYGGRRSRYSTKYGNVNSSSIDLGCPSQLNFNGSLTMECYFKFENDEMKRIPQQLFYHGDGNYWTYIYIQNNTIYAGCNTTLGSTKGHCGITSAVNVLEWTHIAASYDASDAIWRIYINGQLSNPNARTGNIRAGPKSSTAPWIIGSVPTKPYFGKMCEIRIWSCARQEEQIKKCMKVENINVLNEILRDNALRGYWPCHDGVGLLVSDISKYKHYGFVKDCSWKLGEKRPFKCNYYKTDGVVQDIKKQGDIMNDKDNIMDAAKEHKNKLHDDMDTSKSVKSMDNNNNSIMKTEGVINNKKYVLQSFEKSTCSKAVFYTNGEILVIAYPSFTFWNKSYRGVAQKFELTNNSGLLTDEIEYEDFSKILCATFVNDWKSMWVYTKSSPHASCHTMAAPTTISRWRRQRMKYKQTNTNKKKKTLTTKQLATKQYYGLRNIDYFDDEKDEKDKDIQPQDDININESDEKGCITNIKALANILIKLDEDTESLRTVDINEKMPLSLSLPFGVDLNSNTLETLLEIAEKLADEFYAVKDENKDIKITQVRMLTLVIAVRLLRTNINHLISWNVDPYSVGLNNKKRDELGMDITISKTVRERYVDLLNKLVFDRPTLDISKLIENDIHSDCSECLSIGLSVFFTDPSDRVRILIEHVENLLIEANPLRLLLASRYFNSLTKPHNLIALVPALKKQAANRKCSDNLLLLSPILELVYNDCKKELYAYVAHPVSKEEKEENEMNMNPDHNESNLIGTLRQFLTRISVCLFNDDDVFILENYTFPYCFSLMNKCTHLLQYCNTQCIDKKFNVQQKSSIVEIFRYKLGELLSPILTCIWSLNLDKNLKLCSKILPVVYEFIKTLNVFIRDIPDCLSAEREFINSNFNKIIVKRDIISESNHPVPRGFTEKHIFIPGSKSLKLTIDKQTFNNQQNSVGCSLTFYKKSGQNDLIASFTSQPSKSVTIHGDSVYVVFSSGYSNNAWGFKIAVNAKIEEVQFQLPWILDLAKNASIIASKCIGAFLSAKIDTKDIFKDKLNANKKQPQSQSQSQSQSLTPNKSRRKKGNKKDKNKKKEQQKSILSLPRTEANWLSSDLLSSGILFDDENNDKERVYVQSILPQHKYFEYKEEKQSDDFLEDEQMNYKEIISIANKLFPLLKHVRCIKIPTPKDVSSFVDNCTIHVFATLLLHNNLIQVALKIIHDNISDVNKLPQSIIRIYITSQKNFSQWLLQKFQTEYAKKQQELQKKREEELKKKEAKKKKKAKQKRANVLTPAEFKAAFGIVGNSNSNNNNNSNNMEESKQPQQQQPIGMMQALDDHGLPVNDMDEKKQDHEEKKDDEMNDMIMDEQKDKGFSADEDNDDDDDDDMSAMLLKKKKMAMGGHGAEEKATINGVEHKKFKGKKKVNLQKKKHAQNTGSVNSNININIKSAMSPKQEKISMNKKLNGASKVTNMSSKWEVNKKELYGEICKDIEHRCRFLLSVLSVQPEILNIPMGLTRTKSMDKGLSSEKKDNKTAALTAWQHMQSNDLVTLKYATPEQRPSLIWKYVLSFLDEKEIDCDLMIKRVKFDRIKSRLRSYGLNMLRIFLLSECTIFAILRRELIHFLMPSLYGMHDLAFSGKQINILNGLTPIGGKLTNALNISLKKLMYLLKSLLMKPKEIGSNLIKCILYCFSFSYDISELSMVINEIKLFEAIKTLLNYKDFGHKSIGFKTAAWSMMEVLATTILQFKNKQYAQTNSHALRLFDEFLNNVYNLQVEQLSDIAQIEAHKLNNYVPELPKKHHITFKSTIQTSKEEEEAFHDENDKDEVMNNNESEQEEQAFNVRVLSFMLHSLSMSDNKSQIKLFCGNKSLEALLKLSFKSSSPRTRNVSVRLLRELLLNEELITIDKQQFVERLLSNIGQSLLSPVISSYFIDSDQRLAENDEMLEYLSSLRLPELYSMDGCSIFSEQIMIIRYLVRMSTSWSGIISDIIQKYLNTYLTLNMSHNKQSCEQWIFKLFGCLGVFGGYTDTVRVGTKCYYVPENIIAVVTSRNFSKNKVSLIRESEQTHINNVSINEIICIGDEIFAPNLYSFGDDFYLQLMANIITITSEINKKTELNRLELNTENIISHRLFSLCCSTLSSLLLNNKLLLLYLSNFDISYLTAIAFCKTSKNNKLSYPTSILNDRSHIISSILLNRCRKYENIAIELSHSSKNVKIAIKNPNIEFKAEFTKFGKKLEIKKQGITGLSQSTKGKLNGLLSYIKLYEKIIPTKCENKIVCLDTYYKRNILKSKLAQIKNYGAIAVVLLLHSKSVKEESLDINDEDEEDDDDDDFDDGSPNANKKKKKKKRKNSSQNIVDIAANSALRSINNQRGQLIDNMNEMMIFDNAMFGQPHFGGDPFGDLERIRIQALSSRLQGMAVLNSANANRNASSDRKREEKNEHMDAEFMDDEKIDKEKDKENELMIKSLYIMAVNVETSHIIHLLSGIKESEYPKQIYYDKMIDKLIEKGHDKEMAIRALQKNNKMTVIAADKWIKQNRDWLEADIKAKKQEKLKRINTNTNTNTSDNDNTTADDEYKLQISKSNILENKNTLSNTWKLAEKWNKFDDSGLRELNVTNTIGNNINDTLNSENNSLAPTMCDGEWYDSTFYQSSYYLLSHLLCIDYALSIHYLRRALLSIFMCNSDYDLVKKAQNKRDLLQMFNICLSLQIFYAYELDPIQSYLNPLNISEQIINYCSKNSIYSDLLLQFSSQYLLNFTSSTTQNIITKNESKVQTIIASVHGRWEQNNNRNRRGLGFGGGGFGGTTQTNTQRHENAQFFRFNTGTIGDNDEKKQYELDGDTADINHNIAKMSSSNGDNIGRKLKLIIRSDPTLSSMGTTYITIYGDKKCKNLIAQFSCYAFDNSTNVCIVNASSFYYTVLSSSWYQGSPPSNVIITVVDITSNYFMKLNENIVINGSIQHCLTYISSILESSHSQQYENDQEKNKLYLDIILLQLLRCLEFATSIDEAQHISSVATLIFNEWNNLKHFDNEIVELIMNSIKNLERSHEELRTETIKHWSSGTFPGPHVQCLLELLLSAQQALNMRIEQQQHVHINENENDNNNTETGANKNENEKENKLRKLHTEYYTKYRNGSSKLSMISLSKETICKSLTLRVTRDATNRYLIDDFVCDCSVSGGGKWYYEVTFVGQCQYCCIGFIDRSYRKTSNTGLSNDYEGHCWSIVGPNTQYMHRSRNVVPRIIPNNDNDNDNDNSNAVGIASWSPNCTVGVKLNLFENTMEFIFEGKSTGIAFNGFSRQGKSSANGNDSGLYPAISLNQNTSCVINLGGKPFKYCEFGEDGYIGFESPQYCTTSSWLNRYNLASDVTYYLSNKLILPNKIIDTCLVNEVSLDTLHEMRFEIVKTNAMSTPLIDTIFKDDSTLFNSNKPSSTNICFKVSGFKATQFVLTGITIRCSTTSNGFKVMAFICNSDCEPDFDQYNWCSHWTEQQYLSYVKDKTIQLQKPHEPIAYLSTNSSSCYVKLTNPMKGKFITLKIIANVIHNGLHIEYIKFDCIHGKHPLSDLMGKDQKEIAIKKRNEIISELKKYMNIDTKGCKGGEEDDVDEIDNELLTEMSQIIANRLSVSPQTLDCVMLEPTKEELKRFKFLNKDIRLLQSRFALIKYLNRLVTPLLHYIDITLFYDELKNKNKKQKNNNNLKHKSLSAQVHELKGCYFMSTKKSVFDVLLASTATSFDNGSGSSLPFGRNNSQATHNKPRVTINRIAASRAKLSGTDPCGKLSVFGQLFVGLRNIRWDRFKTNKKSAQLWNVSFSGEGSIDVGGPYRESLTYAIQDLQSSATPLFILCPNGKNSVGLNREKYIPNPSCLSSQYLKQYEFVGVLMGIALRTKQTLSFDLPALIYKKLLSRNNKIDISDLEAVDKLCVQALNEISSIKSCSEFQSVVYETFTTSLSDGSIVSLCEAGETIDVTFGNKEEFISGVIKKRLNESNLQIEHIKRGLNIICQHRILSLFTWYDLERMICGDPNISIELLRKHSVYQGGISSSSTVVKHFWNTLHSFTQHERQLFLRFVWGRNRLPATDNDWAIDETFTIKALNVSQESLPIAHTCFFSIDLPPYKTFKICRMKLLYAINNCQAIDVDFNPNSSSLQAWIDDL